MPPCWKDWTQSFSFVKSWMMTFQWDHTTMTQLSKGSNFLGFAKGNRVENECRELWAKFGYRIAPQNNHEHAGEMEDVQVRAGLVHECQSKDDKFAVIVGEIGGGRFEDCITKPYRTGSKHNADIGSALPKTGEKRLDIVDEKRKRSNRRNYQTFLGESSQF